MSDAKLSIISQKGLWYVEHMGGKLSFEEADAAWKDALRAALLEAAEDAEAEAKASCPGPYQDKWNYMAYWLRARAEGEGEG